MLDVHRRPIDDRALIARTAELAGCARESRDVFPEVWALLEKAFPETRVALFLGDEAPQHRDAGSASRPGQRHTLMVPFHSGSREFGSVVLSRPDSAFDDRDALLVKAWADIVALRFYRDAVEVENERLFSIAGRDQLTGVANRRAFDAHLLAAWDQARCAATPISIIILDIDFFKSFNDRYGHLAGDTALHHVAQALQSCLHRSSDLLARFGGEEFVVVLSDDEAGAVTVAEEMRRAVADLRLYNDRSQIGFVTISVGVASQSPGPDDSLSALLSRADVALYEAKECGRNRVVATSYRSDTPAVLRRGTAANGIVPVRTAFIGRERELHLLRQSLLRSRLVTICGPGGVGKTRLATHAATALNDRFIDGVWYADVSTATGRRDSLTALAVALGLKERPNTSLFESVASALSKQQSLIVLDGCERAALDLRDTVDELLTATLNLHVLLVSRDAFSLPGECVVRLGGLAPQEAVSLFLNRAVDTNRSRQLEHRAIEQLCADVDHLPLAIEMIAAHAGHLATPPEHTTSIAAAGLKLLPDVVRWCVALLPDGQQRLIESLTVFTADFGPDAARDVAGATADDLQTLVDASLITMLLSDGEPRYRLLDTTRDLMQACLSSARLDQLRCRHLEHYRKFAQNTVPARLMVEREHIRAALIFAKERQDGVSMLALAADIAPHYLQLGYISEALNWLRLSIAQATEPGETLALACRRAGMLARRLNDIDAARAYNERALELMRSMNNLAGASSALNGLALIAHTTGDFERALVLYEESLGAHEQLGDELGVAQVVNNMAGLALYRGDFAAAETLFAQAIERATAVGNETLRALTLSNAAEFRLVQQRYEEACRLAEESLEIRLAIAERPGLAASWLTLGHALIAQGRLGDAWMPLRESLLLYYDIGDRRGVAAAMFGVVRLLLARSRAHEAALLFESADAIYAYVGIPMFGAERIMRDAIAGQVTPQSCAVLDYEAAFECALAAFQ